MSSWNSLLWGGVWDFRGRFLHAFPEGLPSWNQARPVFPRAPSLFWLQGGVVPQTHQSRRSCRGAGHTQGADYTRKPNRPANWETQSAGTREQSAHVAGSPESSP